MKLTATTAANVQAPAGKADHVIWDSELPGFGLRLRGDTRRWIIQYRIGRQQRRESLGDPQKILLADARKIARQRFAQIELGTDPAAVRASARADAAAAKLTLATVAERYLQAKRDVRRPATLKAAARHFRSHWRLLSNRPIASITRADVAAQLQEMIQAHGRIAAARARANLSALFAWSMCEGLVDANPTVATNDPGAGVRSRDRVLGDAELVTIWRAAGDDEFGCIVKLLILTAARGSEIGGLRWDELDLETGLLTIPGSRTKNHRPLQLQLPEPALQLLHAIPRRPGNPNLFGRAGFTAWSKATRALNSRIAAAESEPLPHWVLHDLRRSAATHMAEQLDIQPHIIETILNHASGHRSGIAAVYNRAGYQREMRTALARWAEHLTATIEGRERRVVALGMI